MNTDALWVAATPVVVFIGAVIAYYVATENSNTDPVPVVRRGESDFEPWGTPRALRPYRLPGGSVFRSDRVIEHDTRQLARVEDERCMTG